MKKILLILPLLVVLPMLASAFQGPIGFEGRGTKGLEWVILNSPELNLSQDQRDKIFDITLNAKKNIDSISTDLMKVRYDKEKELSSPNPDWSKVKSYNDQISKLRANINKIRLDAQVDILSILTKEQRDKLREITLRPGMGPIEHPMMDQMGPHFKGMR